MLKNSSRLNSGPQPTLKTDYYTSSMLYRNQNPYSGATLKSKKIRIPVKKSRIKFWTYLVVLIGLYVGGHVLWSQHVSAQKLAAKQAAAHLAAEQKIRANSLHSQISALISANSQDSISVATYSLIDGVQSYGLGDSFDAASVGKLLTATDYLDQVQKGQASLNQTIDGQTARQWLQAMIINSDDTAWSELNSYLGNNNLTSYAASAGISYDPGANNLTSKDVVQLLQKLYSGKLLNPTNRSLLLDYMAQANYRDYIVPAVPVGDKVYHKVGLDDDEVNDAAIIGRGQDYFIMVIMTNGNGTYDWPSRAALMQQMASDAIKAYL